MPKERFDHPDGFVLSDRGDGLHWMLCTRCSGEFAEDDNGTFKAGTRWCIPPRDPKATDA